MFLSTNATELERQEQLKPRSFHAQISTSCPRHINSSFCNPSSHFEIETPSTMPILIGVNPSPIGGVKLAGSEGTAKNSDPSGISPLLENLKGEDASSGSAGCGEIGDKENRVKQTDSTNAGTPKNVTAKSQLFELCVAKKWKLPLYECCKEEGPQHMRKFTFKVIVEIEEASKTLVECFSTPNSKKKAAAEHAAEAALWYLKNAGYYSEDRRK